MARCSSASVRDVLEVRHHFVRKTCLRKRQVISARNRAGCKVLAGTRIDGRYSAIVGGFKDQPAAGLTCSFQPFAPFAGRIWVLVTSRVPSTSKINSTKEKMDPFWTCSSAKSEVNSDRKNMKPA